MQSWQPRQKKNNHRRLRYGWAAAVLVSAGLIVFGAIKLIGYAADLRASRHTAQELQAIYHAASSAPERTETPSAVPQSTLSPAPLPTPSPAPAAASLASPIPRLDAAAYPDNPKLQISSRFAALRKESKAIVGWLTVDTLVDEAVVQRDNVYYLDHDALGRQNVNGAIFLDAGISLKTRPYTILLYGHNMKTGAMFGSLRNYENSGFYRRAPFITFDTLYEEGRYVIFAVGQVSTEEYGRHYVDFLGLMYNDCQCRQNAIDTMIAASVHTCMIDVQMEDQLLVLVTCVEKDQDRRIVAARRIRPGETEKELKALVEKSRHK